MKKNQLTLKNNKEYNSNDNYIPSNSLFRISIHILRKNPNENILRHRKKKKTLGI